MAWKKLTEKQWQAIKEQLPEREPKPQGGRPPADDRQCFEGILWIVWTGAPWSELPERYGPPSTVHRRLCQWAQNGVLLNLWRAFLSQLDEQGMMRWNNCFVDGTFVPAKKGALRRAKPSGARAGQERGKGTKLMAGALRAGADGVGAPLGVHVAAASPAEVKLLEPTLENFEQAQLQGQPARLIADKGYASNTVREWLVERGMEPIIPARKNNRKATHQEGRKLRRYKHRWIIERTNAWLQNFRRKTSGAWRCAMSVL
jgi:transposase